MTQLTQNFRLGPQTLDMVVNSYHIIDEFAPKRTSEASAVR